MCSQGIIVSSEEGIGWAMNSLDLVHHANYALVHEKKDGTLCGECTFAPYGIPVPLLNLVYHDCVVTPRTPPREETLFANPRSGKAAFSTRC